MYSREQVLWGGSHHSASLVARFIVTPWPFVCVCGRFFFVFCFLFFVFLSLGFRTSTRLRLVKFSSCHAIFSQIALYPCNYMLCKLSHTTRVLFVKISTDKQQTKIFHIECSLMYLISELCLSCCYAGLLPCKLVGVFSVDTLLF